MTSQRLLSALTVVNLVLLTFLLARVSTTYARGDVLEAKGAETLPKPTNEESRQQLVQPQAQSSPRGGPPMRTFPAVRHISVTIDRELAEVYAFAANPENLPRWAKGLSGSIEKVGGEWVAVSPMGKVKIRFAKHNDLGVLDHDVILESGERVHNPMRVLANGDGSEVVFTLYRRPEVSDEAFAADASAVEADLRTLKRLLEGRP